MNTPNERKQRALRNHRFDPVQVPLRQHEGGFAAEGPGYYIWDEDPKRVLDAARELARGNFKLRPSKRFLVLRDDFEILA